MRLGEMRIYVGYDGYVRANVAPAHSLFAFCTNARKGRQQVSRGNFLHRLVMAEKLGRRLAPRETVHHIDGNRLNNQVDNLQLRHGAHGKGIRIVCADCGSHNTIALDV
jgi:hypothetical protein